MQLKETINILPLHILNQQWSYRGEGNANLVLTLNNLQKIVRIKKTERPFTSVGLFMEWLSKYIPWANKIDFSDDKDIKFYTEIIVPLIGSIFVSPAIPVTISRKEINELNYLLRTVRPEKRRNKMLQNGKASLMIDFAFLPKEWDVSLIGPTLAIEIKPKQGWVPLPDRKCEKCPYCLNQHVKLNNGEITKINGYCPLDLFSGKKNRMRHALDCLLKNPQNNLRIFKNGNCIYNDQSPLNILHETMQEMFEESEPDRSQDKLINMLCELLLLPLGIEKDYESCDIIFSNFSSNVLHKENDNNFNSGCNFSEQYLPKFCILERILALQEIDLVGLENNYLLFNYLNSREPLNNWTYIDKICNKMKSNKLASSKQILMEYQKKFQDRIEKDGKHSFGELDELSLVPYIIASIANDCSLMIAIRKIKTECQSMDQIPSYSIFNFGQHRYAVSFGMFDLYPKPLSVIIKHKLRNEKRIKAFQLSNVLSTSP